MTDSELSGILLRLVVLAGAVALAPFWRRWGGGPLRSYAAIFAGLLLLVAAEVVQLCRLSAVPAGGSDPWRWAKVYVQAAGYIVVLAGFLYWTWDVRRSKQDAASRLAAERRRLTDVVLHEAKLRAILNCATEYCIIVCDCKGLITSYSSGGTHILGWAPEEVVGKMHAAALHPAGQGPKTEDVQGAVRERGCFEAEVPMVRKDGRVFPALLTITELKDPDGSPTGYVGIAKDITHLREVQDRLRQERDFIRSVVEANEIFVLGLSLADGRITMFNRGAERASGYTRQEIVGQPYVERLLPPDCHGAAHEWLQRRRRGLESTVDRAEVPIVTKSGQRRIISWTNSLSCDEHGRPSHVVAFGYDLTEHREMQQRLNRAKEELEKANAELRRVAETDFVTGLLNRRQAALQFDRELARARRNYSFVGVVMMDLDRFKPINDQHGHHAGDAVLAHVAGLLTKRARTSDIVARYGGEEFLLVLPEADQENTVKVANALRRLIADTPTRFGPTELPVRASFGVAEFRPGHNLTSKELIARADEALLAAKGLGGNRVVTWTEVNAGSLEPAIAESDAVRTLQKEVAEITLRNQDAVVDGLRRLVERIENKDPYQAGHSIRVTQYAVAIAAEMGFEPAELDNLRRAALLHDLGKAGIPGAVLHKKGTLSLDDWALMMQHPAVSVRIVADVPFLRPTIPIIRHHHERPDGRGYPDGLSGAAIPVGARVLAVADAIDAMTSLRSYREALSLDETLEELRSGAGKVFDPDAVKAALACALKTQDWPLRLVPAEV